MKQSVQLATSPDESAVIDTIILAFTLDPMARWTWPDPTIYLQNMPSFVRAFAGEAFTGGNAYMTKDRRGAALWLPPGSGPDEEVLGSLIESTVAKVRHSELFMVLEKMESFRPDEPHWHLPLIGVDPMCQGRGHGSSLLKHSLEQCDKDIYPAYLESSNPRNIGLYQRYGFKALGEIQCGTSPVMVPMLRA